MFSINTAQFFWGIVIVVVSLIWRAALTVGATRSENQTVSKKLDDLIATVKTLGDKFNESLGLLRDRVTVLEERVNPPAISRRSRKKP